MPARRDEIALDEPEVGAAHEHGRETRVVVGGLEACGALVEQRVRAGEVAERARDAGLVRERVADRRLARDLDERLQRVLEEELQAGPAFGRPLRISAMLSGEGIVSAQPSRARKSVDALGQQAVGAREVAEHPLGDAERVDAERLRGCEALRAGECERALEPRNGDVRLVLRHAELADELERTPLRTPIADLDGDGVALLGERHAVREGAAPEVDRRRGEQRLRAQRRPLRRRLETLREAPLRFFELDPAQPEGRQRDAETERVARLAREQRVECDAQVRRLALEPRRVPLALGERERPARVTRRRAPSSRRRRRAAARA